MVAEGAATGAAAGMAITPNSSSSSAAWRRWARSALFPLMSRLLLASSDFSSETLRSARGVDHVREKQMLMALSYLEIELMPKGVLSVLIDVGCSGHGSTSRRQKNGIHPSAKYTQENETN